MHLTEFRCDAHSVGGDSRYIIYIVRPMFDDPGLKAQKREWSHISRV